MKGAEMKKITEKQAQKIAKRIGINLDGDGLTFYATDAEEKEIFSFDTKSERDAFVQKQG